MKNKFSFKKLGKGIVVSLAIAGAGYGAGYNVGYNMGSKYNINPVKSGITRKVVESGLEKKLPAEQNKGLIVLDPGHGYDNRTNGLMDYGASSGGYKESEIVLSQAKKIQKLLENRGYEVVLTRENNKQPVPLGSRLSFAKKLGADLFVSLHCNAYSSPSAGGIETFYEGENSKKLAELINDDLVDSVKRNYSQVKNRGIKQRNLAVLDKTFPSVLVESGFITNSRNRKYLTDNIPDVEEGIADAIYKYMSSEKN